MKKIMLMYPPGDLYQRGEDRCQANISSSVATSVRACNDLGNIAAVLKDDYAIFLKDYQSEKLSYEDFLKDYINMMPNFLFLSSTNGTIFKDLDFINKVVKFHNQKSNKPKPVIILKGAIFYNPPKSVVDKLDLTNIDFLIGTEAEFIIKELLSLEKDKIANLKGFSYKNEVGNWINNGFNSSENSLSDFKYPDRSFMNNSLYINPESGKTMATIETSRGCMANCIYCLTPALSGNSIRFRSAISIFAEIKECYEKYNISEFFFKSDTFTFNQEKVKELCELLITKGLSSKISWVANSRTKPLSLETLKIMKQAGCTLVAFGFESGSDETLKKIKKGTIVADNIKAMKYAKEVGLEVFGFFMIGFPWENKEHIKATRDHIFTLNPDYLEIHLATPFYGTKLYNLYQQEKLLEGEILGEDYFNSPPVKSKYLSSKELIDMRKKIIFDYHFRMKFIIKKLRVAIKQPTLLCRYTKFGWRLLINLIK